MNRFIKSLAATFLSAAMLFSSAAQAMEIQQFDKMAQDDQAEYVSALIQGAEKVLTDAGKPDLAAQISHLFTTNAPNRGSLPNAPKRYSWASRRRYCPIAYGHFSQFPNDSVTGGTGIRVWLGP